MDFALIVIFLYIAYYFIANAYEINNKIIDRLLELSRVL